MSTGWGDEPWGFEDDVMTPVKIRVQDDQLSPVRVPDVVVWVYSAGGAFVTSGTTDVNGEVTFLLPDGDFDLLFYKSGVSVIPSQPQRITVDTILANTFVISVHISTMPESMDPALCRISGYLLGANGKPKKDSYITFAPEAEVLILNGEALNLDAKLTVQGDANGYFEFDLIRTAKYEAYFVTHFTLLDHSPAKFEVVVPDLPSARLDRVLFPVPTDVAFSELTKALSISAEWNDDIDATVTFSDGSVREKGTFFGNIDVSVDTPLVVEAGIIGGKLNLRGLSPGTANVTTVRRIHKAALWIPSPPAFVTQTVVVTVS